MIDIEDLDDVQNSIPMSTLLDDVMEQPDD